MSCLYCISLIRLFDLPAGERPTTTSGRADRTMRTIGAAASVMQSDRGIECSNRFGARFTFLKTNR